MTTEHEPMVESDAERIARLTQLVELQTETLQNQSREKYRLLALLRKILTQGEPPEWGAGYFHLDEDARYMVIDRSYELSENEVALIQRIREES